MSLQKCISLEIILYEMLTNISLIYAIAYHSVPSLLNKLYTTAMDVMVFHVTFSNLAAC